MKEYCYLLEGRPGGRFHFGEVMRDSSLSSTSIYPHSDTLFGAIIHNAFIRNKQVAEELLRSCQNDEILISSGFFYIEFRAQRVYFIPKPVVYDYQIYTTPVDPKKIKHVKMLSWGVLEKGLGPESWFDETVCNILQDGAFICLKSETEGLGPVQLYQVQVTPKNPVLYTSVGNDNEDADDRKIYYQTDIFLSTDSSIKTGYYFLVKHIITLDQSISQLLEDSVRLIQKLGIGGDRSTGGGVIDKVEKLDFEWKHRKESETYVNLSLFLPKESNYKEGVYKVIKRGGLKSKARQIQKTIQCIEEGGVFKTCIKGQIIEVEEKKLKYCKPYWLPLDIKN